MRPWIPTAAVTSVLVLLLACACPTKPASEPEGATPAATAGARELRLPADLDIPANEALKTDPRPYTAEIQASGERTFRLMCTPCHGADGTGSGQLSQGLRLAMPDFTDAPWQAQWSDGQLFFVLTQGHESMPGQDARLTDEQKWDLIHYVRSFAR